MPLQPPKGRTPSLLANLLSNSGGYVLSVILGFIIAPITIRNLGDSRYGAWSLVSDLIGYYTLLDLGMRGAVTYFVARLTATEEHERLQQTIATAFWVLIASGLVVLAVGVGFAFAFPYIFKTAGLSIAEVRGAIVIMSALIAFGLPVSVFSAVLVGHRRFDLVNGVEVSIRALIGILTYVTMKAGFGLLALASVQALGQAISWVLLVSLAAPLIGGLHLGLQRFNRLRLGELTSYGLRNVVGQVAQLIINRLDLTVVGIFAGVQFVTYYSLGALLVTYTVTACYMIAFVFTPQLTQKHATGDEHGFRDLLFTGLRLSGASAAAIGAGILAFGGHFLGLWVGTRYVATDWTSRSDLIMVVLVLGNAPRLLQSVSRQALYASARVRFLMWLDVSEAACNLVLSLIFVHLYGPIGVAFGTLIPLVLTQLLVLMPYVLRTFHIPFWTYLRRGIAPPLAVGLSMYFVGFALSHYREPLRWPTFLVEVTITSIIGAVVALSVVLSRDERTLVLQRIGLAPKQSVGVGS